MYTYFIDSAYEGFVPPEQIPHVTNINVYRFMRSYLFHLMFNLFIMYKEFGWLANEVYTCVLAMPHPPLLFFRQS